MDVTKLVDKTPNSPLPKYLGEMTKLTLSPGDVLVFHTDADMRPEVVEHISKNAKQAFPDHRVMVLFGGLKLGVLSPSGDAAETWQPLAGLVKRTECVAVQEAETAAIDPMAAVRAMCK